MPVNTISGNGNFMESLKAADKAASRTQRSESGDTLTMQDFFKLMVAQLSNQDMYNTMDNTQYLAQMAQFSMVQAMSELSAASAMNYSVGLIGKEVTLGTKNENGVPETVRGIVEGVRTIRNQVEIIVNGSLHSVKDVLLVNEPRIVVPDAEKAAEAARRPEVRPGQGAGTERGAVREAAGEEKPGAAEPAGKSGAEAAGETAGDLTKTPAAGTAGTESGTGAEAGGENAAGEGGPRP